MSEQKNKSSFKPDLIFWTVVIYLLSFFAWIVIPNFISNNHSIPANVCINQLREIDAAAYEFALEHHLTNGEAINFPNDLTPYIKLNSAGKIPGCPQGGIYSISKVGDKPICSLGTTVTPAHVLQ
jgi:competence protein ComGC